MVYPARITYGRPVFAIAYAWAGVAVMWAFWVSFVIFLAEPRQVLEWWPLPTIDRVASPQQPLLAACINVALVAVFGLQHSMMARPWFKRRVMSWIPVRAQTPSALQQFRQVFEGLPPGQFDGLRACS
jgi:hypothetical protein